MVAWQLLLNSHFTVHVQTCQLPPNGKICMRLWSSFTYEKMSYRIHAAIQFIELKVKGVLVLCGLTFSALLMAITSVTCCLTIYIIMYIIFIVVFYFPSPSPVGEGVFWQTPRTTRIHKDSCS